MKFFQRICNVVLWMLVGGFLSSLHAQSYAKLWQQMEQARDKGLPKTMVQVADQIIQKAEREQNAPQLLKATVWGEYVQSRLTPDSIYAGIRHLELWAAQEKNPVNRSILYSLLAERYQDEMWKSSRYGSDMTDLQLEEAPADMREWSRNLFAEKVDELLKTSLKEEAALLQASAKEYQPFVILGEGSQFYAHDMYHLLVNRALKSYQRMGGYLPDSLLSVTVLNLHRHLAEVYAERPGAEAAALLSALNWIDQERDESVRKAPYDSYQVYQKQAGQRYLQRLDSLIAKYGAQEVCAEAYIRKASWLKNPLNGSLLDCLKTCTEGLKRYAKYCRINELKNIREEVQQPLLSGALCSQVYPGDTLNLEVDYRNLRGFTLNIYRTSFTEIPRLNDRITSAFIQKNGRRVISDHFTLVSHPKAGRPEEEWKYLRSDTLVQVVSPAEIGVYIVQLMPDGGKAPMEAQFYVQSRLRSLVLDLGQHKKEVLVVDARSGHPLEGVEVTGYDRDYEYQHEKILQTLITNAEGKALFTAKGVQGYTVRKDKDTALPRQAVGMRVYYNDHQAKEEKHLTLLTDRAIYRPGQTVYVKGVAYRQYGLETEVLKNTDYELVLLDANRKELSSKKLRTNDFGSFATEFILPSACLNGTFTIQSRDRQSVARIQVEEYKRPTFEIKFTPISEAYCLGEKVVLKGTVKAYNGRSVQQMPLAYKLKYNSWNRQRVSSIETLVSDTVWLDAQGHFDIPLELTKEGVNVWNNLEYNLEAVVTDEAGETLEASYRFRAFPERYSISLSLQSALCKEDSLKKIVHVLNAAQVPQQVMGTASLYRKEDWKRRNLSSSSKTAVAPVWQGDFKANEAADFSGWSQLPSGEYCLQLTVRDSLGREQVYPAKHGNVSSSEQSETSFMLYSKKDTRLPAFQDLFYVVEQEEFDEQQPAVWYLGTSHREVYMMMDVFKGRERIENKVLQLTDTLMRMEYPYQEVYGEGVSVLFTFVKNGKVYNTWNILKKKQPERTLDMKWEVFRDRLRPGQEEEWKLTVKRPDGLPASAEMLAMLYDASLDQLRRHQQGLWVNPYYSFQANYWNHREASWNYFRFQFPWRTHQVPRWTYDLFFTPIGVVENLMIVENDAAVTPTLSLRGAPMYKAMNSVEENGNAVEVKYVPVQVDDKGAEEQMATDVLFEEEVISVGAAEEMEALPLEVRKNFAETAFFYPQLRTNEQGEFVFSFTMPESLTRWNFRGYAHTQDMLTGQLNAEVVTAKEFMVQPNLPRFLRMGDHTQIAAVIANLTEKAIKGTARLTLFDPLTEKVILTRKQKFSTEGGRNATVKFDFKVDTRYSLLGVRITAEGGLFSDGEQQLIPVLSNQVYMTETLSMTVRGGQQKDFSLENLFNGQSNSAAQRRLTVEFTGNPAWYAVQALPSMSVPTSESATDYAAALYANTLAAYIAASQPKIQSVITQWKQQGGSQETFMSQLEKNQELKNILLSESPWVLEATTEADQRARIATLFDVNQLKDRRYAAVNKLKGLQLENGAWSWYKGMEASPSMTSYITELLVRLPLLTGQSLEEDVLSVCQKAFGYLHQQALEEYRQMKKTEKQGTNIMIPSAAALRYLYLIALSGEKVPEANQKAYVYFLDKVKGLLKHGNISQKSQAAVILWKSHRQPLAQDFVASLCEHLIQEEEAGAHFAFLDTPERWGMMPIPVHVEAMEALRQVGGHEALLEEMKLWLLKQKQSTAWNSQVATADAVYALLCSGRNLLADSGEVHITLGHQVLSTADDSDAMVGLNYVKETYTESSVAVKTRQISVNNLSEGMAWGAVYAQYFVPIHEVVSQGGALSVTKQLFVERVDEKGYQTLQPIGEGAALKIGDKVVSRLTVKLDRAMDFIQLKDQRGACFEPVVQLSGYRWMNGFGCYTEVEDAATNFFFSHLRKGVYVFENSCRVVRGGTYEAGIATVQSAYAPEFAAHSKSTAVKVDD